MGTQLKVLIDGVQVLKKKVAESLVRATSIYGPPAASPMTSPC